MFCHLIILILRLRKFFKCAANSGKSGRFNLWRIWVGRTMQAIGILERLKCGVGIPYVVMRLAEGEKGIFTGLIIK